MSKLMIFDKSDLFPQKAWREGLEPGAEIHWASAHDEYYAILLWVCRICPADSDNWPCHTGWPQRSIPQSLAPWKTIILLDGLGSNGSNDQKRKKKKKNYWYRNPCNSSELRWALNSVQMIDRDVDNNPINNFMRWNTLVALVKKPVLHGDRQFCGMNFVKVWSHFLSDLSITSPCQQK